MIKYTILIIGLILSFVALAFSYAGKKALDEMSARHYNSLYNVLNKERLDDDNDE